MVSITYALKEIIDTILALKNPAVDGFTSVAGPLMLFVGLLFSRLFVECMTWFFFISHPCADHAENQAWEVFALVQRHSPEYFEGTLSGKISHKAVMLPEQVSYLLEMCVYEFIPITAFFYRDRRLSVFGECAFLWGSAVLAGDLFFGLLVHGPPLRHLCGAL